jgi:hypothetical protein
MRKRLTVAAALSLLFFVAACSAPIHTVDSETYGWGPQKGVTLAQVRATVEKAALDQGWLLSNEKSGSFTATKAWGGGKHNAVVDVLYNLKNFTIRYKDSKLLGYNGSTIHKTYNLMVTRLEEKIKTDVSKLTP